METTPKKYVAYYRVSTKQQGASGLGLDAQRHAVRTFVNCETCIVAEFTEIESGKNNQRAELSKAIETAKAQGATLIIAKLDRLSRNAGFIFTLRDSGVNFQCADMPEMNTLNVGIFAVMAQHERETISKRTKDALTAKKAQGVKLGSPKAAQSIKAGREKGLQVRQANARANENNQRATEMALLLRANGATWQAIADKLNKSGFKTARGSQFQGCQVQRLYDRAKKEAQAQAQAV